MMSYSVRSQQNRVLLSVAALVLLVSLVLPQLTWADHASDHPESQADLSSLSSNESYAALVDKYESGELVYHAPGRRDNRSFSASPSELYAALVAQYQAGELVYYAPGRRDDRSFSASDDPAQAESAFLASNPEVLTSRRYAITRLALSGEASSARWASLGAYYSQQERAAEASSARWAALGAYHTGMDAAFLAANPELSTFRNAGSQQSCSAVALEC